MNFPLQRRQKDVGQKDGAKNFSAPHFSALKSLDALKNRLHFALAAKNRDGAAVSDFGPWDFGFVSDFEIRISDLERGASNPGQVGSGSPAGLPPPAPNRSEAAPR